MSTKPRSSQYLPPDLKSPVAGGELCQKDLNAQPLVRSGVAVIAVTLMVLFLGSLGAGPVHAATVSSPPVVATASVGSCIFGGISSVGAATSTWSAIRNGVVRSPSFLVNAFWCLGPGQIIQFNSGELA